MLIGQGDEGAARLENIKELKSAMINFCEENESHGLFDYLQQVALISDLDNYEAEEDRTVLMTMHAAKGLEFEQVFMVGAEENIFPSYRSIADPMELEEDRRLCYVAITRAKRRLHITTAESRLLYGQTQHNRMSRFISEIPADYAEFIDKTDRFSMGGNTRTVRPNYLKEHSVKRNTEYEPVESFSAGERINHRVFGEGTVVSASPMGNDVLLEICFDNVGTKKLMAKFAKIVKI